MFFLDRPRPQCTILVFVHTLFGRSCSRNWSQVVASTRSLPVRRGGRPRAGHGGWGPSEWVRGETHFHFPERVPTQEGVGLTWTGVKSEVSTVLGVWTRYVVEAGSDLGARPTPLSGFRARVKSSIVNLDHTCTTDVRLITFYRLVF